MGGAAMQKLIAVRAGPPLGHENTLSTEVAHQLSGANEREPGLEGRAQCFGPRWQRVARTDAISATARRPTRD